MGILLIERRDKKKGDKMGIRVIRQEGNLRLIRISGNGFKPFYRVEVVLGNLLLGTSYDTLKEAKRDFEASLLLKKGE